MLRGHPFARFRRIRCANSPSNRFVNNRLIPVVLPEGSLHFSRPPTAGPALVAVLPEATCELCVAIPAYNEEDGITATLQALATQVEPSGRTLDPARYEVLLFANNCHDATVPLARKFAAAYPAFRLRVIEARLEPPHAHVGAARRLVMDEACRRLLSLGKGRGVIASTDGDTRVTPTWAAGILDEVARGADAVGGRILSTPEEVTNLEPGTRLYYRRDCAYRVLRAAYDHALDPVPHNPWPRHFQYFGASLAVTAETYLAAGGLPVVHCLEDMAFEKALHRLDVRLRHSPQVSVQTSLRCSGRVCVGLSWTLNKWTEAARTGEPLLVESADAIRRASLDRRTLREYWQGSRALRGSLSLLTTARALEIDPEWLRGALESSPTFGALYESVGEKQSRHGVGHSVMPPAEVQAVNVELRARLAIHRRPHGHLTVFQTGLDGSVPHVLLRDGAGPLPLSPETFRGPDRPLKGSRGQTVSNGPATIARRAAVG